ncbi:protein of unknown function [Microbacterium sp. Nx66]|nr:protein of unknown function [Microbacterium sp. Nx66]
MSAQFMQAGAQSISWVAHTVQACSQAAQASMQACSTDMSIIAMSGIDSMFLDMAPIIIASIAHRSLRRGRRAGHPPGARLTPARTGVDGRGTLTRRCANVNPVDGAEGWWEARRAIDPSRRGASYEWRR